MIHQLKYIYCFLFLIFSLAESQPAVKDSLPAMSNAFATLGPRIDYINKENFGFRISVWLGTDIIGIAPTSFMLSRSKNDGVLRYSHNPLFLLPIGVIWLINKTVVDVPGAIGLIFLLPQALTNFRYSRDIWHNTVFVSVGQNTDYYFGDDTRIFTESVLSLKINVPRGYIEPYLSIPWAKGYFANRDPYLSLSVHIAIYQAKNEAP